MISSSSSHSAYCVVELPSGITGMLYSYEREPQLQLRAEGSSTAEAEALIREALRAIAAELEKA